jgi:hypothetical protein
MMNDTETAARAFGVVTEISQLMRMAHQRGCKWESEIVAEMTDEPFPQPTGRYDIRVTIHPPATLMDQTPGIRRMAGASSPSSSPGQKTGATPSASCS